MSDSILLTSGGILIRGDAILEGTDGTSGTNCCCTNTASCTNGTKCYNYALWRYVCDYTVDPPFIGWQTVYDPGLPICKSTNTSEAWTVQAGDCAEWGRWYGSGVCCTNDANCAAVFIPITPPGFIPPCLNHGGCPDTLLVEIGGGTCLDGTYDLFTTDLNGEGNHYEFDNDACLDRPRNTVEINVLDLTGNQSLQWDVGCGAPIGQTPDGKDYYSCGCIYCVQAWNCAKPCPDGLGTNCAALFFVAGPSFEICCGGTCPSDWSYRQVHYRSSVDGTLQDDCPAATCTVV